ncbi:hypothetical protein HDU97_004378 [Phlyctochytrium planicorne]|nr:hypothetical protein HDU97_004378 [Phlyctochytrium planicorne]
MQSFSSVMLLLATALSLLIASVQADPVSLIFTPPPAQLVPGEGTTVQWSVSDPNPIAPQFESLGVVEFRLVVAPTGIDGIVVATAPISFMTVNFVVPVSASGRYRLVAVQGAVSQTIINFSIGAATSSTVDVSSSAAPVVPTSPSSPSSSPSVDPSTSPNASTSSAAPSETPSSSGPASSGRANDSLFLNGKLNIATIIVICVAVVFVLLTLITATILYCARKRNMKKDLQIFEAMSQANAVAAERNAAASNAAAMANAAATTASNYNRPSMGHK